MDKRDYISLFERAFSKVFEWENYANSQLFYLLLLLPVFIAYAWFKSKKDRAVLNISDGSFLKNIPVTLSDRLIHLPVVLSLLAFVFLVFALARPQDSVSWEEEEAKGIDVVIAMDMSSSMLAQDFKPNRLEASKELAVEFIQGRLNDRFGLVVFAGESFTQCPLTIDHDRLVQLFDGLEVGLLEDGTAIGSGLATAVKRLKDSKAISKVVVLLTDGVNNSGDIAPEVAANLATRFGIKIYTIGVGSLGTARMAVAQDFAGNLIYDDVPVEIDEDLLKSIAKKSGGKYFRATSNEHMRSIYQEIDEMEKTEIASLKFSNKTELFLPFAATGFLLFFVSKLLEVFVFKKLIVI